MADRKNKNQGPKSGSVEDAAKVLKASQEGGAPGEDQGGALSWEFRTITIMGTTTLHG